MACVSLQATSTGSFHSLFSWEGRENGSNHNALKWKSGLISLSKGSHLPTENIIQLNAAKESSHFLNFSHHATRPQLLFCNDGKTVTLLFTFKAFRTCAIVNILQCEKSWFLMSASHFPQGNGSKLISPN